MAQYSLGIDIGGTFTDLVAYDHDTGRRWSRKVLTTHDDPARALCDGPSQFPLAEFPALLDGLLRLDRERRGLTAPEPR